MLVAPRRPKFGNYEHLSKEKSLECDSTFKVNCQNFALVSLAVSTKRAPNLHQLTRYLENLTAVIEGHGFDPRWGLRSFVGPRLRL